MEFRFGSAEISDERNDHDFIQKRNSSQMQMG